MKLRALGRDKIMQAQSREFGNWLKEAIQQESEIVVIIHTTVQRPG